ncbi:COPII-coated vesicle component Erv46 [Schizosaccharomyces cryophilus OY26]|uniref:Endoplasmic reticulum-Golgi intermediate compartment protein n=1 Tax=Schizosaccharomyces cryophilus (strain OY26 / ATCC MYA-4695 / CBS 11777 / NBRC 106824 / NRRL Y48691) TaxID=653667 RepID=S9X6F2_SCHCR|nr:COPII-coated vesicle component Erv46 [Schizosaccharomyces cryophilus OY26]EPY52682.1 COPII-coated vesicle component Erv46 [Schizosaccharomyces cryophilus OY26]
MAFRSPLRKFDFFQKTVEDARIKTASGGLITLISSAIVLFVILLEWIQYRKVVVVPEIVVNPSHGERMEINFNVTFAKIPCQLLSVDVLDISGEFQQDVQHSVSKTRLSPEGKVISVDNLLLNDPENDQDPLNTTPEEKTCGDCYGAADFAPVDTPGCCNTCNAVREAYGRANWGIGDVDAFKQCKEEHFKENYEAQKVEGCNLAGQLFVNRMAGNFHIAPGRSSQNGINHIHDTRDFSKEKELHDMSHTIHHLSFGPPLDPSIAKENPLDNMVKKTNIPDYRYEYFIKCVSHQFIPLKAGTGIIDTNRYAVTQHERPIHGGPEEKLPSHINHRGGVPGLWFHIDISPMRVIHRQIQGNTLGGFLTNVLSLLGGCVTLAAFIDRSLYEVKKLKKT